jgi:hypothetical protein
LGEVAVRSKKNLQLICISLAFEDLLGCCARGIGIGTERKKIIDHDHHQQNAN